MFEIVKHTKFSLDANGDGGCKRSLQIHELLERCGLNVTNESLDLPKNLSLSNKISLFLKGFSLTKKSFPIKGLHSIRKIIETSKYMGLRQSVLEKYKNKDIIFINENTTPNAFGLPYLIKDANKCAKTVCLPHNLETFCGETDYLSGKKSPQWLYEEANRMGMYDQVFCISKEEVWLLEMLGVKANYLPYYPPKEIEERLLCLREKRKQFQRKEGKKYLLLGSATNTPTKQGMVVLLKNFREQPTIDFELHIAGYGTECLKAFEHSKFVFHGSINKEELERLLIESDALVIYQPATSGALTRIVESLIVGVPIFANMNAARDYHGVNGIIEYNSMSDLFCKLSDTRCVDMPEIPKRNEYAENFFVDTIKGFTKQ